MALVASELQHHARLLRRGVVVKRENRELEHTLMMADGFPLWLLPNQDERPKLDSMGVMPLTSFMTSWRHINLKRLHDTCVCTMRRAKPRTSVCLWLRQ